MVRLVDAPNLVMLIVVIGLLLGAGALALSAFAGTMTAGTTERLATDNATLGLGNLAAQLPTVGTIIGVALIIAVVIGAFAFTQARR